MPKEKEDTPRRNRGGNRNQPIVSCLECRRMKWRCDRQFPCAHCRRRGLSHQCPGSGVARVPVETPNVAVMASISTSDNRREQDGAVISPGSGSAEAMAARIAELEGQLDAVRAALGYHPQHARRPLSFAGSSPNVPQPLPEASLGVGSEGGGQLGDDGQLTVGDEPGRSTFYGSAATHYLIGREDADMRIVAPFVGGGGSSLADVLTQLPSRDVGERWLGIYFDHASFMNDIVERGRVTAELEAAYNLTPTDNQQVALVLVALAIGASADLNLPPYNAEGERLFMAARVALNIDPSGSMAFVQCITLMSRFLANRANAYTFGTFWTTLGTAARCAQSLGLHRDGSKWGFDPEVTDLRRRVFWEIHTEDILQSVTQGRPRCIAEDTIDCRLPTRSHNGDRIQTLCKLELQLCELTSVNDAKYRLVRIMGQINDQQTTTRPVPYADTMRLHRAIREFECDLAPELRSGYSDASSYLQWQRLYLRLLVHVSYNFLHHAHFARCLRDYPAEPLSSPFHFSYVAELDASRAILDIFNDALEMSTAAAARFWIFFFDAFTSTINFAGVAMRAPLSSLAPAALSQAERGVELAGRLPEGIRGREDIPMLRRVLARAQKSMTDGRQDQSSDDESTKILRTGHQVVRQPRGSTVSPSNSGMVLQAFSTSASAPPGGGGLATDSSTGQAAAGYQPFNPTGSTVVQPDTQRRLPETLEEAREAAETFPGPELELELDPLIFHVVQDDFGRCIDDELEAFISSIGLEPLRSLDSIDT